MNLVAFAREHFKTVAMIGKGLACLWNRLRLVNDEACDRHGFFIRQAPIHGAVVRGDVAVRDLNRAMDWSLPDEEAVTIAGLVIHESQTIPEAGQTFAYHGYRFEVLSRKRNQIQSLRVRKTFEPDQRGV